MTKEEIGLVLKELRTSCGMTQKEVAKKIGRTQQIVGHWETGYAQPDANTLFTLSPRSWDDVEEVSPDEWDLNMLDDIDKNPDCHKFIPQEELLKELGLTL